MNLQDQAAELVALADKSANLDADAMDHRKLLKKKREELAIRMAEDGLQNLKLVTGERLVIHRKFAFNKRKEATQDEICAALMELGMEDLIKTQFATATLKAYVKELEAKEEDPVDDLVTLLPKLLQPFFTTYEEMSISISKS